MPGDILAGINPAVVTPFGALVLVLVFLLRAVASGQLVPRRTYEDILADRDRWRKVSELDGETLKQIGRQIDGLVDASKTTIQIMQTLQREHEQQQQMHDRQQPQQQQNQLGS